MASKIEEIQGKTLDRTKRLFIILYSRIMRIWILITPRSIFAGPDSSRNADMEKLGYRPIVRCRRVPF